MAVSDDEDSLLDESAEGRGASETTTQLGLDFQRVSISGDDTSGVRDKSINQSIFHHITQATIFCNIEFATLLKHFFFLRIPFLF